MLSFYTFHYESECTLDHSIPSGAVLGPCSWVLCLPGVSECVPLILLHLRDSSYLMILWVVWLLSPPLPKRFLLPLSATQTFHTLQHFSCVKATAVVEQCVRCNPIIKVLNITIIITRYIENNIDNQGY